MNTRRWLARTLAVALIVASLGAGTVAHAQNAQAKMLYGLARAADERREYEDAAVLYTQYAEGFPSDPDVMAAWRRAFEIYSRWRPDANLKKETLAKALAACDAQLAQYETKDKNRAAEAMWTKADFYSMDRRLAEEAAVLAEMVKRFPGLRREKDGYLRLGQVNQRLGRFQDAVDAYRQFRKLEGATDASAGVIFAEGNCFLAMGNYAEAINSTREVMNGPYNWKSAGLCTSALDMADAMKLKGEMGVVVSLAQKVLDNIDSRQTAIVIRAKALLGEIVNLVAPRGVSLDLGLGDRYVTDAQDVDARTKYTVTRTCTANVELAGVTADMPFVGSVTVSPKRDIAGVSDDMQGSENNDDKTGHKVYTRAIVAPDRDGKTRGFWETRLVYVDEEKVLPVDLTITRKWETTGEKWGICTVTITSRQRWSFRILLPKPVHNLNFNLKPDRVDGGTNFWWSDRYDMTKGVVFQFPAEVDANTKMFCPRIELNRRMGDRDKSISGYDTDVRGETTDMTFRLSASNGGFPFTARYPTGMDVVVKEITK